MWKDWQHQAHVYLLLRSKEMSQNTSRSSMCPWERAVHLRSHFLQRKEAERTLGQQQSVTMSSFKGSTFADIVTGWTQGHKQKSEMSRHVQTLESCLLVTSMETGQTVYQVGRLQRRRRPPTTAFCSVPDPVSERGKQEK